MTDEPIVWPDDPVEFRDLGARLNTPRCADCHWFHRLSDLSGDCRRRAPRLEPDILPDGRIFPRMAPSDYCGDFQQSDETWELVYAFELEARARRQRSEGGESIRNPDTGIKAIRGSNVSDEDWDAVVSTVLAGVDPRMLMVPNVTTVAPFPKAGDMRPSDAGYEVPPEPPKLRRWGRWTT